MISGSLAVVIVVLAISLAGWVYCLYWILRLRRRFASAFASLDSEQDLATTIVDYFDKIGATKHTLDNLQQSYQHLSEIGARSFQKSAVVRFNPFRNTGGDQSFVLALLDNNESGMLLTSIHGREGTRVYIKPITFGNSEHTLSSEESQALKQARQSKDAKEVHGTS